VARINFKRKTRSDKFPVTLHKTGPYCKKIKSKLYYFGTDRKTALNRYLEQAAFLHAGNLPKPKCVGDALSIKILCNLYLAHQESSIVSFVSVKLLARAQTRIFNREHYTTDIIRRSWLAFWGKTSF